MILTLEDALKRVAAFEDSGELADRLRGIALDAAGGDAYYLNESAEHIEGLFDLARSLAHHARARALNGAE